MAKVRVEDGESIDAALRRFKKEVIRAGIIQEIKKRETYENPKQKKRKSKEEGRVRATFKRSALRKNSKTRNTKNARGKDGMKKRTSNYDNMDV